MLINYCAVRNAAGRLHGSRIQHIVSLDKRNLLFWSFLKRTILCCFAFELECLAAENLVCWHKRRLIWLLAIFKKIYFYVSINTELSVKLYKIKKLYLIATFPAISVWDDGFHSTSAKFSFNMFQCVLHENEGDGRSSLQSDCFLVCICDAYKNRYIRNNVLWQLDEIRYLQQQQQDGNYATITLSNPPRQIVL